MANDPLDLVDRNDQTAEKLAEDRRARLSDVHAATDKVTALVHGAHASRIAHAAVRDNTNPDPTASEPRDRWGRMRSDPEFGVDNSTIAPPDPNSPRAIEQRTSPMNVPSNGPVLPAGHEELAKGGLKGEATPRIEKARSVEKVDSRQLAMSFAKDAEDARADEAKQREELAEASKDAPSRSGSDTHPDARKAAPHKK
jgi:hypothetical protein